MMRANMQGLSGFKGILLKHGEKVGLAVIGLVVAWFIYSSIGKERLPDDAPQQLNQLVTQAKTHIEESNWDAFPDDGKKLAANVNISGEPMKPILPEHYPDLAPFSEAIITQREKRRDPEILTVEDIEVRSGAGMIAHFDPEYAKQVLLAQIQEEEERRRDAEKNAGRNDPGDGRGPGGRGGGRGEGGRGGGRGPGLGGGGGGRGGVGPGEEADNKYRRPIVANVRPIGYVPQGDERVDLQYWTIVTGKVAVKQQLKKFREALRKAYGFDNAADTPEYFGYFVERAEVGDDGTAGDWVQLQFTGRELDYNSSARSIEDSPKNYSFIYERALRAINYDWPVPEGMEPVVKTEYLHPMLTYPLPPVVAKEWGEDATHSDVPLFDPSDIDDQFEQPGTPPDEEPNAPEEGGQFGGAGLDDLLGGPGGTTGRGGEGGGMRGGPGGRGGRGGGMMGGRGGDGGRGGGMLGGGGGDGGRGGGGMMGGRGGEGGGMRGGGGGRGGYGGGALSAKTEFFLFRFFDFSVSPGKKYKYRVRLMLRDPNDGFDRRYLAKDVIERRAKFEELTNARTKKFSLALRMSDWSEPSRVVGIPRPGQILAAEVSPASASNYSAEPYANLMLRSFEARFQPRESNDKYAVEAVSEEKFYRGMIGIILKRDLWVIRADRSELFRAKDFQLDAGAMLVDMVGGEKLDGASNMDAPGEVLLMDLSGRLYTRSELDDEEDVMTYKALLEEDRDGTNSGGRGGGYGGVGGEGGRPGGPGGRGGGPGLGGGRGGGR